MNSSEPIVREETNLRIIGYSPKFARTRLRYLNQCNNQRFAQVLFEQIEILNDLCLESISLHYTTEDIRRLNKIGTLEKLIRRERGFFGDFPTSDYEILLIDRAIGLNIRKGELTEDDLALVNLWQSASQKEKVISFIVHLHILASGGLYDSEEHLLLMFKHACILYGFMNSPDPLEILNSARSKLAKTGGDRRKEQFAALEAETIRLYKLGKHTWPEGRSHVPKAAEEITPKIVIFSKGKGNLFSTTTKPIEWIRHHINSIS
jgi:hypothetical protein